MSTFAPPQHPPSDSRDFPQLHARAASESKYPKPPRLAWTFGVNLVVLLLFIVGSAYKQVQIRHSDIFLAAVRQATGDQRVIERFGTPITIGWFLHGNSWWNASSMSIPIEGPKGTGWINAATNSNDGAHPHFVQLEVFQQNEAFLINLLSTGPRVSPESLTKFGQVYVVPFSKAAEQLAVTLP